MMPDQQQGTPAPGQPIPQQPVQQQYPVQPGTPPPGQPMPPYPAPQQHGMPVPHQPVQPPYPAQQPEQSQYSAQQMNIPQQPVQPAYYPPMTTPAAAAPHQQAALWFLVGIGLLIVLGALVIIVLAVAGVGPFDRNEKIAVVTPVPANQPEAGATAEAPQETEEAEPAPTMEATQPAVEGTDEPAQMDMPHAQLFQPVPLVGRTQRAIFSII